MGSILIWRDPLTAAVLIGQSPDPYLLVCESSFKALNKLYMLSIVFTQLSENINLPRKLINGVTPPPSLPGQSLSPAVSFANSKSDNMCHNGMFEHHLYVLWSMCVSAGVSEPCASVPLEVCPIIAGSLSGPMMRDVKVCSHINNALSPTFAAGLSYHNDMYYVLIKTHTELSCRKDGTNLIALTKNYSAK